LMGSGSLWERAASVYVFPDVLISILEDFE
jgi:hypothetical protein